MNGCTVSEFIESLESAYRLNSKPERYRFPLGYSSWDSEEVLAGLECLLEQRTTMWTKCEAFENEFAEYLCSENAVMVNSGSSADLVMMMAAVELGMLKPGDEILIPAVTWPTQVWAALQVGLKVKFVDVDVATLNTSPQILEKAIGHKTKAVFLVHLMGNPCNMEGIQDLCSDRILIFEDCCEALGARFNVHNVGTFGLASAFSFFASHHISTMEGGMVCTNNPDFAEQCRLLRAHGWARDLKHRISDVDVFTRYGMVEDPRYLFLGKGFNFRPTELQGAIGSVQLKKLDAMNEIRNQNFRKVNSQFHVTNGHFIEGILPTHHKAEPAWFALPFVLREGLPYTRKDVTAHLERHGIDTRPIVGGNLARHPGFAKLNLGANLPGANAIHDRGFYVGLPPKDISLDAMIGALNSSDPMIRSALCA